MIDLKGQIDLFRIIGRKLKDKTECIAIGGTAMMFLGAKESTKDIDLVFMDKKSLEAVKKVLYESGFEEKKRITIFKHYEAAETKPVMMEGKEVRFDLFYREIISAKMTDRMLDRTKEEHEFDNLTVKIVSPEDIIFLKCATEREKDRYDALELIKKFNINWDVIVEESQLQTEIDKLIFPVFLYDFLCELKEDLKADIPAEVIKKIMKIGEKAMLQALSKKKTKQSQAASASPKEQKRSSQVNN